MAPARRSGGRLIRSGGPRGVRPPAQGRRRHRPGADPVRRDRLRRLDARPRCGGRIAHTMAAGRLKTAPGVATPDAFTRLHWESSGSGPPLLLIMGLGLSGGAWWRSIPTLAKRFRVLTYDNRGTGRSTALTYTYTTEAMADDALAVLDSAGVERVDVYGMSLGGMVAQQLALRHPKRVGSLGLGATQPGGRRAVG